MIMKNAYPRPDFERHEWLNLNGPWDFSLNNDHLDMVIEVPYPWGSPLSGILKEDGKEHQEGCSYVDDLNGTGYYRRMVSWNPKGERIVLNLGAVDYTCTVLINGVEAGKHQGGYAQISLDVTSLWKRDAENEILVIATDTAERSQTYGKQGYGDARGIWQTVWLETTPCAYIASFFTKTLIDGTVSIEVETAGCADGTVLGGTFSLMDDPEAASIHAEASVCGNKAVLTLHVNDPKLWTPDTPYLYGGALTLGADSVSTYFGIREIGTGVFGQHQKRYITLNGKPIFLFGVLDQSFNPQGFFTLPTDDDCREEIERMKRIGLNMARIHIKAEEPLKLYWADRLGLLIMEDIPNFWGEPLPETRAQYEKEMEAQILRDRNHPSVFYWVVFNETWGLFHKEEQPDGTTKNNYRQETAEWVISIYRKAKEMDPTRLVEDNSPCNKDHTITDVNTWHFYSNGYERVKEVVDTFCDNAYVGSPYNYKEGYTMGDVPCMNSECGNVWGITGNAGDSDISWEYKYMMNEFRLHDTLCGFIFTEFHDVVNEFNGYYRIDNDDKDFGYDEYGMTLRDLHAPDFLAAEYPPMTTAAPEQSVCVPIIASSFSDQYHGEKLNVLWTLTAIDPVDGDYIADQGEFEVDWNSYGTFPAGEIRTAMPPCHDGICVLTWALYHGDNFIMQNCTLFDVAGAEREDALVIEPSALSGEGWYKDFCVQEGNKRNGLGSGSFSTVIQTADIPSLEQADDLRILFEASTRMILSREKPVEEVKNTIDIGYMLGYRMDPAMNPNTFFMTDHSKFPGSVDVLIDGQKIHSFYLEDCPADSRGALSHHYQKDDHLLDEAGTYGTLCDFTIPSALLLKLQKKESFTLTFKVPEDCGLSLYGRKSGRYAVGIVLRAE